MNLLRIDGVENVGGLYRYHASMNDETTPPPVWPALWPSDYGAEREKAYLRYSVDNVDGECLAVWRALAWNLLGTRRRFVIPVYHRDSAAAALGVRREDIVMVGWEYKVAVEEPSLLDADVGFVRGRTVVTTRHQTDSWYVDRQGYAGLFELTSLEDLTQVELAIKDDVASTMALFGVGDDRQLLKLLNKPTQPNLVSMLGPGDRFVTVSIVRDRFLGFTSYLMVKSVEPIDEELSRLVELYNRAYEAYTEAVPSFRSFEDFAVAMDALLTCSTVNGDS